MFKLKRRTKRQIPRLAYHFEPQTGWMNDPNGLVFFRGRYHAFFQYYPHAPKWGQMHWGHAVSDDLLHWEQLETALFPEMPYEDGGGCYSGSAVVRGEKLYLFYTSVDKNGRQTQSLATSEDGVRFAKYEKNPIIRDFPKDGSKEFRDPKVTLINGIYYMVCGSGKDGIGKVLLYRSENLFDWSYQGVLFEGAEYGKVIECPDFFPLGENYVLIFSQMHKKTHACVFAYGDFDGKTFSPRSVSRPEAGPHFYAPQTFTDEKGRRILIAWLYHWDKKLDKGATYAGALTIPREIKLQADKIVTYPVEEAQPLLTHADKLVTQSAHAVSVRIGRMRTLRFHSPEKIYAVDILRDTKTIEVFVNNGAASFSHWFHK